jgi:hypothetical protein
VDRDQRLADREERAGIRARAASWRNVTIERTLRTPTAMKALSITRAVTKPRARISFTRLTTG